MDTREPARNEPERGWWKKYDLPYGDYVGFEATAIALRDFDPGVFPGLLQTPDYARALHERAIPRLPAELIERRLETRRIRQQVLLRDNPPSLAVILDEAVLHRVVGCPKVMAEQLAHVIKACAQGNVTVQILPYSAGAHPALDSPFILLEFPPGQPSVVYVEDLAGPIYRRRPDHVRRYAEAYDLLAGLAMGTCESIGRMEDIRAKYEQE